MKKYFTFIAYTQNTLMTISVLILLTLPFALAFFPETLTPARTAVLYSISYFVLLFVMSIRPIADLLPKNRWARPLVILRKGAGVFSASIIISIIFSKIIIDPQGYFAAWITPAYWSLASYALFAHLADIATFLLLITSNKLSKRVLGRWWKRIQRLSYVYFYGSSIFIYATYSDTHMLYYMIFITTLTTLAFLKNYYKRKNKQ